jgi:hypothetical protein
MKIKLNLLWVLGIFVDALSAQPTTNLGELISDNGNDLYLSSSEIAFDLQRSIDEVDYRKFIQKPSLTNLGMAGYIHSNLALSKAELANFQFHFFKNHEMNKVRALNTVRDHENYKFDEQKLFARAWLKSRTGQLDGRLWEELDYDERKMYERRYIEKKLGKLEPKTKNYKIDIAQEEFAQAWEIKNLANPNAADWNNLNFNQKNNFRREYHSYKIAKLTPKIEISEEEFAEAWEVAQIGNGSTVDWHSVSDQTLKTKFRQKYHALKSNSMRGVSMPSARPDPSSRMIAARQNRPPRDPFF